MWTEALHLQAALHPHVYGNTFTFKPIIKKLPILTPQQCKDLIVMDGCTFLGNFCSWVCTMTGQKIGRDRVLGRG